jgi:hypothetical protein
MDPVAISNSVVEALQHKDAKTFSSCIASASVVKCVAPSVFVGELSMVN